MVSPRPIGSAVKKFIKRMDTFDGIKYDPDRIHQIYEDQKKAGRHVVMGPLKGILPPKTHSIIQRSVMSGEYINGLEASVRFAGFGAILGYSVVKTLGKPDKVCMSVAEWAGLWNLLLAYFDDICDEYEVLYPQLIKIISPDALRAVLRKYSDHRLISDDSAPVLLQFVVNVADEVFRQVRSLANSLSNLQYERLTTSIENAYEAELRSANLKFSEDISNEEAQKYLSGCNALPVWILGHTSALIAGISPPPKELNSSLRHIGDVIWFWDDIMDIEEDIEADQWNAVFLVASDQYGSSIINELRHLNPEDRISWLYRHEMADALADRMFDSLVLAINDLDTAFGKESCLASDFISILYLSAEEILDTSR